MSFKQFTATHVIYPSENSIHPLQAKAIPGETFLRPRVGGPAVEAPRIGETQDQTV